MANAQQQVKTYVAYENAPMEYRDFFMKAAEANKLVDPLARCLAFPDAPGNQWAVGEVKAHCEFNFSKRPSLVEIKAFLDSGNVTGLDELFNSYLERHFSKDEFSEEIHALYELFDSSYESGRLSKVWLDKAPNSAYAMVARAEYFRRMASTARGGKYVSETPQENLARMSEFSTLSVDLYQRALVLEPRMIQAYVGLLSIGAIDSRSDVMRIAIKKGYALDPACYVLTSVNMDYLEPRWGGSYPQMQKLAEQFSIYLPQRPLLSINVSGAYLDMANTLWSAKKYPEAVTIYEKIMPVSSDAKPYESAGLLMSYLDKPDRWRELLYLVAASRFTSVVNTKASVNRERGRLLLFMASDLDGAYANLKQAVMTDPEDANGHYLLGSSLMEMNRFTEAEAEYLLALNNKTKNNLRRDSLYAFTSALLLGGMTEKARTNSGMLVQEFPDYAKGWLQYARVLSALKDSSFSKALEKFMALADPKDESLKRDREQVGKYLQRQAEQKSGSAKP
ncbi:MAG: tetratricopeptide repeat protein [Arenimonas sp.]